MMRTRCRLGWVGVGLAGLLAGWPVLSPAHGDLHEQIAAVSKQIEEQPRNADLYLKRGELHRAHLEFDAAQADYDRALNLDPGLVVVHLARGRMFLEAGWPRSAVICLDQFLGLKQEHAGGLTARARALGKLGEVAGAERDYTAAIRHSREPGPELFIERALVLAGAGSERYREALAGLEEGIAKLGSLVTLQLQAIDLEVRLGDVDGALARVDLMAAKSPRKETWLARRGEILRDAGRKQEAKEAFGGALQAMDRLPPSRGRVPAMLELRKRVAEALELLDAE